MRHEVLGILGLALWFGACNASSPGTGGETHWLARCSSDAECPGLECLCGVCSVPCAVTKECAAEWSQAVCVGLGTEDFTAACVNSIAGPGLCLAACSEERPCGDGTTCRDGACVPARALSLSPPRPSDYLGIEAGVAVPPFVDLPEPETVVAPFDPAWAGTWATSDGARCDSERLACFRLTLDREGRGTVIWLPPATEPAAVVGPFPPALDPGVGYPPGIVSTEYQALASSPIPGVPYRVLDGRIDGASLSFWVSPIDLWQSWCDIQASFPAGLDPAGPSHRCVPDGATALDTDPARLQLCSSACLTPGNCSTPYCTCGPDGCRAALQSRALPVTLTRAGSDRLVGSLSWSQSASVTPVELVRVGSP